MAFFLETDDFAGDHARMTNAGVNFIESPRDEPYGMVVVFEDLYGNRWDLLEHREGASALRSDVALRPACCARRRATEAGGA